MANLFKWLLGIDQRRHCLSGQAIALLLSASVLEAHGADYIRDVKPILRNHCFRCHGPQKAKAKLRLDTRALALKGGKHGPAFVVGNVEKSLLLQKIAAVEDSRMPPEGEPLSEKQIELLKTWITDGAQAPAGEKVYDTGEHWAFQRLKRPTLPAVENADWGRNPVDAFVAQKHAEKKVTARPEAPRHVLLRRVYLDLIGLPPTREQLRAFLADTSSDAYANVVDRLLASPHYGERWGRHWMDVWRYSDWYGFQNEVRFSQKNMWHWRDWIVESLNVDKGYAQMVTEMLAADEMLPFNAANLRATGLPRAQSQH